uniref:site-specific DNA-methyltransferase (adenine-specific) n=1 Tax=viral metagenome TaxID=1070528 RepID=A0A6C0E295_9ZZZZ
MIHELTNTELYEMMNSYLPIRTNEKNKYGEVLTPPKLIEEIINHFPETVWSDPYLTWIDPTCGTGNFIIMVYMKLMSGLASWIPDPKQRSKHIIENMLYMVELNDRNANVVKKIFGPNANIIEGDFLTCNSFNKKGFDMIVGNPPFQDDVLSGIGGIKRRSSGKNKLYERIILRCLQLLNRNGWIAFITPDNLFSGGSKTYLKLIQNNITLISFHKTIQSFFPKIQQYMCYFVMNMEESSVTKIFGNHGEEFECSLTNRPLNPVRNWTNYTEELMNKYVSLKRNGSVYNRGKPTSQYNQLNGEYTLIYKPSEKIFANTVELAIGYGIKKIAVFLISPDLKFESDFDGKYGIGPNIIYIPLKNKEEGNILETFLKSNIYKTLALSTKTNRQFLKIKLIEHLHLDQIVQDIHYKPKK